MDTRGTDLGEGWSGGGAGCGGARRAASSASCIVVAGILPSNRAAGEGSGVAIAAGVGSAGMKRLGHCFAQKPSQFSSRMAAQCRGACARRGRASSPPSARTAPSRRGETCRRAAGRRRRGDHLPAVPVRQVVALRRAQPAACRLEREAELLQLAEHRLAARRGDRPALGTSAFGDSGGGGGGDGTQLGQRAARSSTLRQACSCPGAAAPSAPRSRTSPRTRRSPASGCCRTRSAPCAGRPSAFACGSSRASQRASPRSTRSCSRRAS